MPDLGSDFYHKLLEVSSNVNMKPEDILNVMAVESGINPAAHNKNGNASGLVQFMPRTLKDLGFTGTHDEFRQLSAVDQLDYVQKLIKNMSKINGGPFTSAAQYYVGNFVPAALKIPGVRNGDLNTIIVSKNPEMPHIPGVSAKLESKFYAANSGLDYDKDGNITLGDIQAVLTRVSGGKNYQTAMADLNKYTGYSPKRKNNLLHRLSIEPSNSQNLEEVLDQYLMLAAASSKPLYKLLPSNDILIQIRSDDFTDAIEYARVLSSALEEELLAKAYIHTNGKEVEIQCSITGPDQDCANTIQQLSETMAEVFQCATKKIGSIKILSHVVLNKHSSYKALDLATAEQQHRKFLLKFI
jgi:hypothetical protein